MMKPRGRKAGYCGPAFRPKTYCSGTEMLSPGAGWKW